MYAANLARVGKAFDGVTPKAGNFSSGLRDLARSNSA
jgi:hypothetical protein